MQQVENWVPPGLLTVKDLDELPDWSKDRKINLYAKICHDLEMGSEGRPRRSVMG